MTIQLFDHAPTRPEANVTGAPGDNVVEWVKAARRLGRRPMALADDPDRWELGFVHRAARAAAAQRICELRIIDTFVTLRFVVHGDARIIEHPDNNLESHRRGRPDVWVWMPKSKHLAALKSYNERLPAPWRYQNAFRPVIDDLRAKLRRYRQREEDARRLGTMADIWEICLCGKRIDKARRLAASIGEAGFFEEKMRPRYFPYAAPLMGRPI